MSEAYRKFYEDYKNKLFSYLLSRSGDYDVSRDIMQESFTRHFQHYGHAAALSPALLFTIARNALIDHLRLRDRFQDTDEVIVRVDADEEKTLIAREESARIHAAMAKLSGIDREVLTMAVNGFAYREIAESCKLTEANVKVRIHRARIRLRRIMHNEE